jgi:hypothetical protein
VAGRHARLARQVLAIAKIPHGVLQPGVADELGVRRKGLEPGAEQRLVATGDPEARPAARTVAPQHARMRSGRLGVPVEPGLEHRAERDGVAPDVGRAKP